MRRPAKASRLSNAFRFLMISFRPMPMWRWPQRRRPAITAPSRHRRTNSSIRSAVRLKSTESSADVTAANSETSAALTLLNAAAVRSRAHRMLALALDDKLPNFRICPEKMDSVVDLVLQTTREAYPDLDVPFDSR